MLTPRLPWRLRWHYAWHALRPHDVWRELDRSVGSGHLFELAAQTAFWSLLALFPFAIVVLSGLSYIPYHGLDVRLVALLFNSMPPDAAKLVTTVLTDVVGKQQGGVLIVALLGAWWTASSGITAMMASMNKALGVIETRPYWRTKLIGLGLTAGGSVLLMLAVMGIAVGSDVGERLIALAGLGNPMSFVFALLRYAVVIFAMMVLSGFCYWLLPNTVRRGRFFVPGMIVSTACWVLVSLAFSTYVARFASYSRTYGPLGAAIVLMTWLYLGGLVMLLGAVINACFDHAYETGLKRNRRL